MSTHYFRLRAPRSPVPCRSAALEHLLARSDGPFAVADWRREAFQVLAPQARSMPGLGAAALFAAGGSSGALPGSSVFFATPVHYVAEMSNVRLASDGIVHLNPDEAAALAGDFNRIWHDAGVRLWSAAAGGLFAIFARPHPAVTQDPEAVLGRHIDQYLPAGADAARLRQLMSEIEMWLFDHSVNRRRLADAARPVTGLWFWGGGPALDSLPAMHGWTAGSDPFFAALAGTRSQWSAAHSAVIVPDGEPGSDVWRETESRWLAPAIEQLSRGRLTRIELSAGDRSFRVSARRSWRFWQRVRPWWEYFS